mmetsp:Transcript_86168/g.278411  ORF Transcript_86168/g.278411 Transcript_86168/m.278411 type:complete len:104 (-) Transcript_86168:173-484(-)
MYWFVALTPAQAQARKKVPQWCTRINLGFEATACERVADEEVGHKGQAAAEREHCHDWEDGKVHLVVNRQVPARLRMRPLMQHPRPEQRHEDPEEGQANGDAH